MTAGLLPGIVLTLTYVNVISGRQNAINVLRKRNILQVYYLTTVGKITETKRKPSKVLIIWSL